MPGAAAALRRRSESDLFQAHAGVAGGAGWREFLIGKRLHDDGMAGGAALLLRGSDGLIVGMRMHQQSALAECVAALARHKVVGRVGTPACAYRLSTIWTVQSGSVWLSSISNRTQKCRELVHPGRREYTLLGAGYFALPLLLAQSLDNAGRCLSKPHKPLAEQPLR